MLTTLFILRLASAVVLLAFVGGIGWILVRDMRLTADLVTGREKPQGALRVITTESSSLSVGQLFDLLPVTGIGRAPDNTIVLDDEYASSSHLLITRRGQQWWLEDLHSSNGTFLNEQIVSQPMVVSTGDNITIGTTTLRLELG